MNRLVLSILAALLLPLCVQAQSEEQITDDGQYAYVVNADQLTATITEYYGPGGEITIPSTINGLLVTALGEASFFNKGLQGTLTIPDGVRRIELDAFNANHGLTRVNIPASVNFIHPDAFTYCDGVIDVYLYHVYPDLVDPPLYHELDWADPTAASFGGNEVTIIHVMKGTVDAHMSGAYPEKNVAIRKWMEQNPASVVDDIELPTTLTFSIDPCGFGVVYSTTGWVVPKDVVAVAVTWDDITVMPRFGNEEVDTPTLLIHYGWDADNPWVIEVGNPTHKYVAGMTVPMGCGVIVRGKSGTYTADLDYSAGLVPFRNLLHGRDFAGVSDFPSTATDAVVGCYRFGYLRNTSKYGYLWENFIVHNDAQDQWTQDDGQPFVAEANTPWLALTSDNGEGELSVPQDAHFYLTFSNDEPTSIDTPALSPANDDTWVDLLGRRYRDRPTVAGIYLHNGKKIIIP